jgi:integrase
MALPQFVRRRGERLYYHRAYPKELWPVTRSTAFAVSLRTADPKEALKARPEAERRYHARVDEARAELVRRRSKPPLTKPDAQALAIQWFLESLDAMALYREGNPQVASEAADEARERIGDCRRVAAEGDWGAMRHKVSRVREEAGFAADREADNELARLLTRAAIAANEVEAGRAGGRLHTRPEDPLFASAMEAHNAPSVTPHAPSTKPQGQPSGPTIADLETAFRKVKLPGLAPGTVSGYPPVFRLLKAVIGEGAAIGSLTHADGEKLFETVKGLPVNAQKRRDLRGLPLAEQIEKANRLGLPTLSPKTINDRYMANLTAMFSFAQKRGWIERNPVQGLRARAEVAAADAREPFGERLPDLFGAAPWQPRDATGEGKPIRYWGPLLALYHGLRLGEVAGLLVRDIGEEQGTPVIHIRAGVRPLKTASARRDLPLHPELVRLGFLEFVKERKRKAAADGVLFAGEKAYARQQWGRALGNWFTRRVRSLGLKGRKLTFHSLRHDFRDALREAEVERSLADYIMGHAQQGVGAIYGAGRPSLARLNEAMAKVRFEGVRLSSGPRGSHEGT